MQKLKVHLLSKEEKEELNNLKEILDNNPETDFYKYVNYDHRSCDILLNSISIKEGEFTKEYSKYFYSSDIQISGCNEKHYLNGHELCRKTNTNGQKILNFLANYGILLPIFYIDDVEQKLNKKITGEYADLFLYPQQVVNSKMQKYLRKCLQDGKLIRTDISIEDNTVFCDKISNKKYIYPCFSHDKLSDNSENILLNDNVLASGEQKKLFVECSPIKFYVCKYLNYLIPTKFFLPNINPLFFDFSRGYPVAKLSENALQLYDENRKRIKTFVRSNDYIYLCNTFQNDIDLLEKCNYYDEFIINKENINNFLNLDCKYFRINRLVIYLDNQLTFTSLKKIFQSDVIKNIRYITINSKNMNSSLKNMIQEICPSEINLNFISAQKNDIGKLDNNINEEEINTLIEKIQTVINTLSLDIKDLVCKRLDTILENHNQKFSIIKKRLIASEIILMTDNVNLPSLYLSTYIKLFALHRTLVNRPNLLNILDILSNINKDKNINDNSILYKNIKNIFNIVNKLDDDIKNEIIKDANEVLQKYQELVSIELNSIINKEIKLVLEEINYEEEILNELYNIFNKNPNILLNCQVLNCFSLLNDNDIKFVGENNNIQKIIIEIRNMINSLEDDTRKQIIDYINEQLNKYLNDSSYNSEKIEGELLSVKLKIHQNFEEIKEIYKVKKLTRSGANS